MFDYCNLPWRPSPISTPILPLGRLLSLLSYATVERLINNSFCASFKNYQFHQWLLYTVRAAISSTLSFLKGGNNNTFVSGLEQSWLVERNLATDHLTLVHLVLSIGPKPSPSDVSFLPVQSTRDGTYRNGPRPSWCAALILFAHRNLQSTSSRPVTGLVRHLTCDTYGIVVMFSCLVVHFRKNFPAICWYMGRQEPRGFRFFWCVYQCLSTSP